MCSEYYVRYKYADMISFGIMTVLLATMACVVHYDLLSLLPAYPPQGRHAYTTVGEHQHGHQHQPAVDFNGMWVPRPGTDPYVRYPGPMVLPVDDLKLDLDMNYDDDDDDEFWSEVTDPDDDTGNGGGDRGGRARCSSDAKAADDDIGNEDNGTCPAGVGRDGSGYPRPGPSLSNVDVPGTPSRDELGHRDADGDQNGKDDDHENELGDDGWFDDYDDDDGYVAPGEEYDDDVF